MSEQMKASGWQQPAVYKCSHIGALFASLAVGVHSEGHEWVCTCGLVFVVVSNGGKDKRLIPRTRPTFDSTAEAKSVADAAAAEVLGRGDVG